MKMFRLNTFSSDLVLKSKSKKEWVREVKESEE